MNWNLTNSSHRERFGEQAGVNPNTIQRALSDLEREGFVYSKRTTGRFVTEDLDLIVQSRKQLSRATATIRLLHASIWLQKRRTPNVVSDYIKGGLRLWHY